MKKGTACTLSGVSGKFIYDIQEEAVKKPSRETWEFSVSKDSLINLGEIEKNLTRKHPVAIVSYDAFDMANQKKYKMATVLIHGSIHDKAQELGGSHEEDFYRAMELISMSEINGTHGFVDIRSGFIGPIMAAIRAIRDARVSGSKKLEVTVDMMEI